MPSVQDIRAELAKRQPEKSGHTGTILSVLVAFIAGGLLVFGWQLVPAATLTGGAPSGSRQGEIAVPASAGRLGQASAAPLLRSCLTHRDLYVASAARPWTLDAGGASGAYKAIESISAAAHTTALLGQQPGPGATIRFATIWGRIAECVYNQDAPALCDIDNRALAVDSLNNFVRHSYRAAADVANTRASVELNQIGGIKERLMVVLRSHLRDGALVAADFGIFASDEVRRIGRDAKPARDVCAAARR